MCQSVIRNLIWNTIPILQEYIHRSGLYNKSFASIHVPLCSRSTIHRCHLLYTFLINGSVLRANLQ